MHLCALRSVNTINKKHCMSSNIRIQKVCLHCKSIFTAKTTVTKFCSDRCAKLNYKERQRAENIENSKEETRKTIAAKITDRLNTLPEGQAIQKMLVNVLELSIAIGMSRRTIFNLMEDKKFPRIKVGRKLLFDKIKVVEYIKNKYSNV